MKMKRSYWSCPGNGTKQVPLKSGKHLSSRVSNYRSPSNSKVKRPPALYDTKDFGFERRNLCHLTFRFTGNTSSQNLWCWALVPNGSFFFSLKKLATTEAWTGSRVIIFSFAPFRADKKELNAFWLIATKANQICLKCNASDSRGKGGVCSRRQMLYHEHYVKETGQWECSNHNYWFPSPGYKEKCIQYLP